MKVIVEPEAEDDYYGILNDLPLDRAFEFAWEFDERKDQIATFPESYQEKPCGHSGKMKRVFYISRWSTYYVIRDGAVYIQRILPSRMDPTVPLLHS